MSNLVYIHKGYSWYVPLALRNGRKFCTGKVYFIGDPFGCWVARWCGANAWPIRNFSKAADDFAKIYHHHSEMGKEFELFCIQRWFVLAEFMADHKLEACTYLDTDVLLTRKLDAEQARTAGFGLTYTGYSAHVCFINRLVSLQQFCAYVTAHYADPAAEEKMENWHQQFVAHGNGGGVSDMTLFYWFQKEHPEVLGDYPALFGDSPFDVSLDEVRGFQKDEDGFKRLVWESRRPFALTTEGRKIELAALHHQGRAKCRLKEYAGNLGVGWVMRFLLAPFVWITYRIGRKVTSIK